ncbi:hypothetical protein NC652_003711 [Populus alba x Populus x berolinensis]|nr:hypothetical protein NC652_003711 [Populus alba x Populus x berolinensis]
MSLNFHLSGQPLSSLISQHFSHLSIVLTALHLHLSSLNFFHISQSFSQPPSSSLISQFFSQSPSTFSSLISLNLSLRL